MMATSKATTGPPSMQSRQRPPNPRHNKQRKPGRHNNNRHNRHHHQNHHHQGHRKYRPNNSSRYRHRSSPSPPYFSVDPAEAAAESLAFEKILKERGCCLDDAEHLESERERSKTLDMLEQILNQWVLSLGSASPAALTDGEQQQYTALTTDEQKPYPRVALITFGSYRLRVHRSDSDLDVLALSPPICRREDFFTSLVKRLEDHPNTKDIHPISSAFTPVIKFILNDFHVDMLFGRVEDPSKLIEYHRKRTNLSPNQDPLTNAPPPPFLDAVTKATSPPTNSNANNDDTIDRSLAKSETLHGRAVSRIEYMIDDCDLAGMDEAGVRSMNGARVSQILLEIVPNLEHYRTTLRAVKEWAIINGIYSNVLGFLGGINFAMLVAWVCIRNPGQLPPTLLRIFFRTFAMWYWPTAVTLVPIQNQPPQGVPKMPVWDPNINPRDRFHLMPIITPAYPSMNSAYNVGTPQLRRLQEEMVRAAFILDQGSGSLRKLFEKSDFFERHSNFLQISIRADNATDFIVWQRLCESRMRLLITSLETTEVMACPFAKFFRREFTYRGYLAATDGNKISETKEGTSTAENAVSNDEASGSVSNNEKGRFGAHQSDFFIALRFAPGVETCNVKYLTSDFLHKVNSWEERTEGMDLQISHVLQQDLPHRLLSQGLVGLEKKIEGPPHPIPDFSKILGDTTACSSRPNTPVDQCQKSTGLTPKVARSTLSCDEILGSPTKRARNEDKK